jgi:hypothetical protein
VRHRVSFERPATGRQRRLEFVEQPRLAGAGLRHHRDDLPVPGSCLFERALQLLKLTLAADEPREAAPRGDIEMAARRPGCSDVVDVDRTADPFDFRRSEAAQLKITFHQTPRVFADHNAVRRRHALHARRQIDHVTDW